MAEMTAQEAVAWLTDDKALGQECYSRKQIAKLIEQQAAETIMLKKLQICATCHQYDPVDEWGNDKIHACKANKKLENVSSHDKCIQWEIARWL